MQIPRIPGQGGDLNDNLDRVQSELLKLSEALLLCQQELADLRQLQEHWEEQSSELRRENEELARRSAQIAGASAAFLREAYWRSRGRHAPISLRAFIAARWPALGKLFGERPPPGVLAEMDEVRRIEACSLFDARWYLERRPDVAAAGVHPALHYLRNGALERCDPGPEFDTRKYRKAHPELDAETNPLLHYLQARER